MTVCIVDTSIFCNVLDIPGKNQRCDEARGELAKHIEAQWNLLLPMVAIIETGNHIGHLRDGGDRRRYAVGVGTLNDSAMKCARHAMERRHG